MFQNNFVEGENNTPKEMTISNDELTQIPKSNILTRTDKNTSKKCFNESETKNKNNIDSKQFKVKLFKYTKEQKDFTNACEKLIKSYEEIKKYQTESSLDKDNSKYELHKIVKKIIETKFGMEFRKPNNSLMKDHHQPFVFNLNLPSKLEIDSTSGHQQVDLAIKDVYGSIIEFLSETSKTTMKYHFWLKNIIEPNEFYELNEVREYLISNGIFNEERTTENYEQKLNTFLTNLQLKLINVINVVNEIRNPNIITQNDKFTKEKEKIDSNAEVESRKEFEEHKQKMNMKIKTLEIENKKLKAKEFEYSNQVKSIIEELAVQNKKLNHTNESLELLRKEKHNLIHTIEKMEIKDESFHSIRGLLEKEKEINKNLRKKINNKTLGNF